MPIILRDTDIAQLEGVARARTWQCQAQVCAACHYGPAGVLYLAYSQFRTSLTLRGSIPGFLRDGYEMRQTSVKRAKHTLVPRGKVRLILRQELPDDCPNTTLCRRVQCGHGICTPFEVVRNNWF